jgi:hypothetical protein
MFSGLPLCLVPIRWDRVRRTWQPDHDVIYSSPANRRDLLQPSTLIHRHRPCSCEPPFDRRRVMRNVLCLHGLIATGFPFEALQE